jgi:hypothetical protein
MFLTPAQLEDLTGYTQPAAQVRWLRKNGVTHYVRADGHPRVPVSAFQAQERVPQGPNFEALRVRH